MKSGMWNIVPHLVSPEWRWLWERLYSGAENPVIAAHWEGAVEPYSVSDWEQGIFGVAEQPTWQEGTYGKELLWPAVGASAVDHHVRWVRALGNFPLTYAVVVKLTVLNVNQALVSNECDYDTGTNLGLFIEAPLSAGYWGIVLGGVLAGTNITTPAPNTADYFFVAGTYDNVRLRCFVRNLTTGVEGTSDDALANAGTTFNGHWGLARWGKTVAIGLDGVMPMGVISDADPVLTFDELRLWANDPMGFLQMARRRFAAAGAFWIPAWRTPSRIVVNG